MTFKRKHEKKMHGKVWHDRLSNGGRFQRKAENPLRFWKISILKYLRSEGRLDLEGMSMATGITKEDLLRAMRLMGLIKKDCEHEGFFQESRHEES